MSTQPPVNERRRLAHLLEASEGGRVGANLPRRSLVFDVLLALAFAGSGYLLLQVLSPRAGLDDALFVLFINLPLVMRRRFPKTTFFVVFAVGFLQMLLRVPIGLFDVGLLFALYSAVGYTNRRFGLLSQAVGTLAVLVGAATSWWSYVDRQLAEPSLFVRVLSALGAAVVIFAAWALGERLRSARLGVVALTERAAQLEREREQQAQLAAVAERARIAREMHDVIAHGLSVMIVQADGAAYMVEQSPEMARKALEQISSTGRESLAEMRNLLGLLRTDSGSETAGPTPQPTLDQIPDLIADVRSSGADVAFDEQGDRSLIPQMLELTTYRVLQEALTNARKHGGGQVVVDIDYGGNGLGLTVRNNGPDPGSVTLTQEPGHGLKGMAERVAAVGGTLHTGPAERGGFDVQIWLPYPREGKTS